MKRKHLYFALAAFLAALIGVVFWPKNAQSPRATPLLGLTLTWYHGVEKCEACALFESASRQVVTGTSNWRWREVSLTKETRFARDHGIIAQSGLLLEWRNQSGAIRSRDLTETWEWARNPSTFHTQLQKTMDQFAAGKTFAPAK